MSYRVVVETEPVSNRMRIFLINENRQSMSILRITSDPAGAIHQWVPHEEATLMPEPTLHLESGLVLALHEALREHFPQPHTPGELDAARLQGELTGATRHVSHLRRLLDNVIGLLDPRIRTQVGAVNELRQAMIHGETVSEEAEPDRLSSAYRDSLRGGGDGDANEETMESYPEPPDEDGRGGGPGIGIAAQGQDGSGEDAGMGEAMEMGEAQADGGGAAQDMSPLPRAIEV